MTFRKIVSSCCLLIGALFLSTIGVRAQTNFVYADNDLYFTNAVSGFAADANGVLTEIPGSPFSTGGGGTGGGGFATNRIIVGAGKFLFVANGGTQNISVFAIDPSTGILTPVLGSPFPVGGAASFGDISLAATPNGQFLIAAQVATSQIYVFNIAASGALTPVPGAQYAAGGTPNAVKVSPDGKYVAVSISQFFLGKIAVYSIGATGILTPVPGSPFPMFGYPAGLDISCSGKELFAGDITTGTTSVDAYNIASDGSLSHVTGAPFRPGVGQDSAVVQLNSNDQVLFVSNQFSNTVTALSVAADGSLSLVSGSPFSIGGSAAYPSGMAMSKDGSLLYVANSPNLIAVFSVNGGALNPVAGSPFSTGQPAGLLSVAAYPSKSCAPAYMPVNIAIGQGTGASGAINLNSNAEILIAILSNSTFDAPAQVDQNSLTFGHTGDEQSLVACTGNGQDVNQDGFHDLVCRFRIQSAGFQPGDTTGTLKGKLIDGAPFQGSGPIRIK